MRHSRRSFLRNSAVVTAGSLMIPSFTNQIQGKNLLLSGKKLIIIQLSGGNDGLSTVVPYRNDIYYRERSGIALKSGELITLDSDLALNKNLKEIADLYHNGSVSIINGVGYPNPNRSHFRSMDIWQTASNSTDYVNSGWLGRYLDANCDSSYYAIEAHDTLSLALKGELIKGMAVKDMKRLMKATRSQKMKLLVQNKTSENQNLDYMYKTLIETEQSSNYLFEKLGGNLKNMDSRYPQNEFGKKMNLIANLIKSGIETKVYYADLGGFDTHVRQKPQHNRLLETYSKGVSSLVSDLKNSGQWNDTIILTFSEFGRRVKQNGAGGTDHGTANSVFIMGGSLKNSGIFNNIPNLQDLDQGDLKYSVDFRQIYATLLEKWLNSNSERVLGSQFMTLPIV